MTPVRTCGNYVKLAIIFYCPWSLPLCIFNVLFLDNRYGFRFNILVFFLTSPQKKTPFEGFKMDVINQAESHIHTHIFHQKPSNRFEPLTRFSYNVTHPKPGGSCVGEIPSMWVKSVSGFMRPRRKSCIPQRCQPLPTWGGEEDLKKGFKKALSKGNWWWILVNFWEKVRSCSKFQDRWWSSMMEKNWST